MKDKREREKPNEKGSADPLHRTPMTSRAAPNANDKVLAESKVQSYRALGNVFQAFEKCHSAELATIRAEIAVENDDVRLNELFSMMDDLETTN